MFIRALLAFLLLPGIVAFAVPLLLGRDGQRSFNPLGLLPLVAGAVLLVLVRARFLRGGEGHPAPWDPPRRLVVVGLNRWTRNPMYVAVALILLGWAVGYGTRSLWVYALAVVIAFHLRVVLFEEPWLARTHGEEWVRYRSRVRRWLV